MKLIIFYEWRNNEFSQEMLKKTRAKYLETDPYYTLNTHIHIPRWTKDLNVKKLVAYTVHILTITFCMFWQIMLLLTPREWDY